MYATALTGTLTKEPEKQSARVIAAVKLHKKIQMSAGFDQAVSLGCDAGRIVASCCRSHAIVMAFSATAFSV